MSQSLEHILFMKLKEDMTEAQHQTLVNKIDEMKATIPGVLVISFGKNFETERNQGFNYGYRVLLRDPSDLPVYADHPLHIDFKNLLNDVRAGPPAVVDYLIPRVNM
eukprot:gene14811-17510_t